MSYSQRDRHPLLLASKVPYSIIIHDLDSTPCNVEWSSQWIVSPCEKTSYAALERSARSVSQPLRFGKHLKLKAIDLGKRAPCNPLEIAVHAARGLDNSHDLFFALGP
jgi:hypothetical protein